MLEPTSRCGANRRSIAGVIVDLCEELAVSLYPAGGFTSITFAYEAADFIRDEVEAGKHGARHLHRRL